MTNAALLPRPLVTRVAGTAPWRGVAAPEPGAHGVIVTRHPGAAESYRLRVDESGIEISAADDAGVFYAGRTLAQLATRDHEGWVVPAIEIEDAPRFRHRGFMLDVARHFFPVEVVTALIDRLSDLKLNVLHLHLSDDQGWRLAMATRPLLTERASATAALGDAGGFYTADDYRTIVAHATSRHMTVVPEIDMPGHTHAVSLAYPDIACDPVLSPHIDEVVAAYGGGVPTRDEPYTGFAVGFSSLRTDLEETYDFVRDVVGELAALTPGPYLHLGGDEALGTDRADFDRFVARAARLVIDAGKIPVTWHEAGTTPDLPEGTVGQYWGFRTPIEGMDEKARGFVRRGGRVILSPADAIYLDMKPDADEPLGLTWADGPTSLERSYDWDPAEVVPGVAEADILGVEAAMWTETVRTAADIDRLIWPRLASAAEKAWSPRGIDAADFHARVARIAWRPLGGVS